MTTSEDSERQYDLIRARIPEQKKQQLALLAKKRGITEARLLRQALYRVLKESDKDMLAVARAAQTTVPRKNRLTIPINPGVRRLLQDRAALRSLSAGSYVSRLIQAHLNVTPRLPTKELVAIERVVHELNALGRELNQLVKGVNDGAPWAEAVTATLAQTLETFARLSTYLSEFARTTRKSWESAVEEKP